MKIYQVRAGEYSAVDAQGRGYEVIGWPRENNNSPYNYGSWEVYRPGGEKVDTFRSLWAVRRWAASID